MPEDQPKKQPLNYPGNTHKARIVEPTEQDEPGEKRVQRIVTSDVIQRKKPLGKRIAETFAGDDMHSVGHYVLFDVMLPAAKDMLSDAVSQGVQRMLFGEARSSSGGRRTSNYTSYNRMYGGSTRTEPRRTEERTLSKRARANHDLNEVVLESRGEAEAVIQSLVDLIDQYDAATVSDLYSSIGITGSFTDDKWGWNDLRGARVTRVRDGYLLDLPRPIAID